MPQYTDLERAQASEHHFAQLLSGEWLFKTPVGDVVILLKTEEDKERMLDKWTHYYVQHHPSHFVYLMMIYCYPLALIYMTLTKIGSVNQVSPQSRFQTEFADELERYPRSSLAQFMFAKSGELLSMIKVKYGVLCLTLLLSISLLIGFVTETLPPSILELMSSNTLVFSSAIALCAFFAGSTAWSMRTVLKELAET